MTDAVMRTKPGVAVAQGGSVEVMMSAALWAQWFEVATDRDEAARAARADAVAKKRHGQEVAHALSREHTAALVAVSASAHALDAIYGQLVTDAIKEDGPREGAGREAHIRECLKRRFRIGGQLEKRWISEFRWLFELRDAAVHAQVIMRPSAVHPSGVSNTSQDAADYCADSAMRAVDLLRDVLVTCAETPKPGDAEACKWAADFGPGIRTLVTALAVSRDRQPLVRHSETAGEEQRDADA